MTTEADHSLGALPFALLSYVWGSLAAELRLNMLPSQMRGYPNTGATGVYHHDQPFVIVLPGEQTHRKFGHCGTFKHWLRLV